MRRPSRPQRRLLITLACLVLGPILAEVGVRVILFGGVSFGASLRDPARFANPEVDGDYWKLHHLWSGEAIDRPHPQGHPLLGWSKSEIHPTTYAHSTEVEGDTRRKVLLFGASTAACMDEPEGCWGDLLDRSDLGGQFSLLNYAVRGHGLDQGLLLMREVLDRHASDDPVVVLMPFAPTDLNRCGLAIYNWPKPHFELDEEGRLDLRPGFPGTLEELLQEEPVGIRSYFARLFLMGAPTLGDWFRYRLLGYDERVAERNRVVAAITRAIGDELAQRGLEHFVLLTHNRPTVERGSPPPGVLQFEEQLWESGVPRVSTLPDALSALAPGGGESGGFYSEVGAARDHPTAQGNLVLFEGLRRGLLREYDLAP